MMSRVVVQGAAALTPCQGGMTIRAKYRMICYEYPHFIFANSHFALQQSARNRRDGAQLHGIIGEVQYTCVSRRQQAQRSLAPWS